MIPAPRARKNVKELARTKTLRMVMGRCKKCGEWTLSVQKATGRNRYTILDYAPMNRTVGGQGRVMVYKKHHCGRK